MTPCLLQHQGYMYQLNSRILNSYFKYPYSLPATKPAAYPRIYAPPSTLAHLLWFIFGVPPFRICCRLVSLRYFPARRHVWPCWCRACIPRCPLVWNPRRHAWLFGPRLLSSATYTAYSRVQLTQIPRSSSVYVQAISAKVPVVHPAVWVYKGHS